MTNPTPGAPSSAPVMLADLSDTLRKALAVIDALMPGVKHIAVQDYAALNEVPVAAREVLAKYDRERQSRGLVENARLAVVREAVKWFDHLPAPSTDALAYDPAHPMHALAREVASLIATEEAAGLGFLHPYRSSTR